MKSNQLYSSRHISYLAIDGKIEQRQVSGFASKLRSNPDCPDFFQFERQFLTNQFSLVPGSCFRCSVFHDGLRFSGAHPSANAVPEGSAGLVPKAVVGIIPATVCNGD